jgi:hypothetical protein
VLNTYILHNDDNKGHDDDTDEKEKIAAETPV